MIRAVLFDLDGVIRHFDATYVTDLERRYGIPMGTIERFAFDHPLIDDLTTGRLTRREWVARVGEHIDSLDAADEWGRQPYRVDPEVLNLADELRVIGVATPILTNGTDTIPVEVELLGLPSRFDPIFNSATIGYAKPDKRAFDHVLAALDLPAREVFFTDDSPGKLAGADALGMPTHRFIGVEELRRALRIHGVPLRGGRRVER